MNKKYVFAGLIVLMIFVTACNTLSSNQKFNDNIVDVGSKISDTECWDNKKNIVKGCTINQECWYIIEKEKYLCVDKNPWEWMCENHFNILDGYFPPWIECVGEKPKVNYVRPHITDIQCSINNRCPDSLKCWSLGGYEKPGAWCVDSYPQGWYCNGKAMILESFPPKIICE